MSDLDWNETTRGPLEDALGLGPSQTAAVGDEVSSTMTTFPSSVGPIGRFIRRLLGRDLHSGGLVGTLRAFNRYKYDLPPEMQPPEIRRDRSRRNRQWGYMHEAERAFAVVRAIRGIAEILYDVQADGHRQQRQHHGAVPVTQATNGDLRTAARNLQHRVSRNSGHLVNPLPVTHPEYYRDVNAAAHRVLSALRNGLSRNQVQSFVRDCAARGLKPYCGFVLEYLTAAIKKALVEVEKTWNAEDVTTYTRATLDNGDNVLTAALQGFLDLGTSLNDAGLVALELYGARMVGLYASGAEGAIDAANAMRRHLERFTPLDEDTLRAIDQLREAPRESAARGVRADVERDYRARLREEAESGIRGSLDETPHNEVLNGALLVISYLELIHAIAAEPDMTGSRAETVRSRLELGLSIVETGADTITLFNAVGEVVTVPRGVTNLLSVAAEAAEVVGKAVSFVTAILSIVDGFVTISNGWQAGDELMVGEGVFAVAAGCAAAIGLLYTNPFTMPVAIAATVLGVVCTVSRLDRDASMPGAKKVMKALVADLEAMQSSDCDRATIELLGATAEVNRIKTLIDEDTGIFASTTGSIAWDMHSYMFLTANDPNSRTIAAQTRHTLLHARLRKLQIPEAYVWLMLGYHDPARGNDSPPGEYARDPYPGAAR